MRRGFLSVLIVLCMLLFLSKDLRAYNQLYAGIQEIKNQVELGQRINDATYDLENGFILTAKEALDSLPVKHHSEKAEVVAREHVCQRIYEWFRSYPDYSLYIGYMDPTDYSEAPSVQSEIEPCFNFLYVDVKDGKIMVKDNSLIDFPYSLVGYRIGFMFYGSVHGSGFKAIIPEGTVIE